MKSLRYILLFVMILVMFSCKKFNGSQEIPAYIKIEPWTLTTNYEIEGAATEAITDAWLYVNGNYLGCYELKSHSDGIYAMAPILDKGEKTIHLYPGVKQNGRSSTRIQYPFYKPYIFNTVLNPGEIQTVAPSTKYYNVDSTSVTFRLKEDFEEINNIKLYRIDTTYDAQLEQISHRTNPNAWMDPLDTINRYRSGHIHLGDTILRFGLASPELYNIPNVGNYVLMEMDYKCDADIEVGLYLWLPQEGIVPKQLYFLRPTDTWKKIYLNYSPTITDYYDASYVKFYLKGAINEGESADFYFDNIKLIYLD